MSDTSTISPGQYTPAPSTVSGAESERVAAFVDDGETRIVAAGSCQAFLVSGKVRLPCTCPEGRFELLLDGEDGFLCEHCCHHLVDHQDFGSERAEGTASGLQATPALEAAKGKASVMAWRNAVPEQTQKPTGSQAKISASQTNSAKSFSATPSPQVQTLGTPTKHYRSPESRRLLFTPRSADQPEDSTAERTPQQLKLIANAKSHPNQTRVDASRFSPTDVPRTATLRKLLGKILQHRIVQVIGPRYSGKSTLASQLSSVASTNGLRVCHTAWPEKTTSLADTLTPESALLSVLKMDGYNYGNVDAGMENTLIIIDRAERLSSFTQLWESFLLKRIGALNGPFVVLFGTGLDFSYGPPVVQPLLPEHHRVPLEATDHPLGAGVYYEKSEFVEAVRKLCSSEPQVARRFEPMSCLIDTFWYYSDGHPGVTNYIINVVSKYELCVEAIWNARESGGSTDDPGSLPKVALRNISPVAEILYDGTFPLILRDPSTYTFIMLSRSRRKLEIAALDAVLASRGVAIHLPRSIDPDVQNLVENNALFAFPDGLGSYVGSFPTPFHRTLYDRARTTDLTFSEHFYKLELEIPGGNRDIDFFVAFILRRMDTIRNKVHPKSYVSAADYEDLFYQAVYSALGGSFMRTNEPVPLSANLSSAPPRFTIAGPKWGFEVYHNGEGFSERVSMYRSGGCMEKWCTDNIWSGIIVLDFRVDGHVVTSAGCDPYVHLCIDSRDFSASPCKVAY